MEEPSLFEDFFPVFNTDKKIRLITLFSGYDSQAMAMDRIGADYEIYKTSE